MYSSNYYSILFHKKKRKDKKWSSNFFLFHVIPTSIEYINLHERFPNLLPFPPVIPSNTKVPEYLDHPPLRENSSHVPRRGAFRPDDGGKMDRVCRRAGKKKKRKEAYSNLSCTRTRVKFLTRDRLCTRACICERRTTLLPKRRLRVHCATPASHSNNRASGCLHADTGCHWNLHGAKRLSENRLFREAGHSFMGGERRPSLVSIAMLIVGEY